MACKITRSVRQKLLEFHEVDPATGCWNWTHDFHQMGYGVVNHGRARERAHRASYREFVGEIPSGMLVCHRCDNRRCMNPEHLFLGTHKDNTRDMVKKDRHMAGERHHNAKLTAEQVADLRADQRSYRAIAMDLGISPLTVGQIKRRESWRHI